jgi:HAMP domain-containing protein
MVRSVSIYQSLLGNLALVIVLLSGAIMALTFIGSRATVERLSGVILGETIGQTEGELRHFFEPVIRDLGVMRAWGEAGLLDDGDAAAMNRLLVPLLRADPQLSAVMVADERGREHIVFHFGDAWSSRQTRRDVWGDRSAWLEWTDARPEPVASRRASDYDPRRRPWYQGAASTRSGAASQAKASDLVYWTEPYTFYTAQAPGMTAAMAFPGRDGRLRVVGVDLLLTDVSTFTTRLRVGEHGAVMVLTDGSRVIGLPRDPRYLDAAGQRQALLKRPEELEMRVPADAARILGSRPPGERGPVRLESGGAPWWAETGPVPLGPLRRLAITVMVPESDLLGNLGHLRLGIVLVMLAGLALAMVRAVSLARRYSRPIEALVRESERISRGDLDPGAPVTSSIREVHRLADAHGRMRQSLKTLLKLEGDSRSPGASSRTPCPSGFRSWLDSTSTAGASRPTRPVGIPTMSSATVLSRASAARAWRRPRPRARRPSARCSCWPMPLGMGLAPRSPSPRCARCSGWRSGPARTFRRSSAT